MIRGFRHKGLKAFYSHGSKKGIDPQHADRLQLILTVLDAATTLADCGGPGMNFHPLKGKRQGEYAVTVRSNWRVVFRWEDEGPYDLDYLDYH